MKTSLQEIEVKAVEVKLNISIFEQESQGFLVQIGEKKRFTKQNKNTCQDAKQLKKDKRKEERKGSVVIFCLKIRLDSFLGNMRLMALLDHAVYEYHPLDKLEDKKIIRNYVRSLSMVTNKIRMLNYRLTQKVKRFFYAHQACLMTGKFKHTGTHPFCFKLSYRLW